MLRFRSKQLVDFEHYLQVRQPVPKRKSRRAFYRRAIIFSTLVTAFLAWLHANPELIVLSGATIPLWLVYWISVPKQLALTPDQELLAKADASAEVFQRLLYGRRLRGALHSGVAAVLNECAASWRRIVGANQSQAWGTSDRAAYWSASRQDWTRAADLAMAEALVIAECSITFKGPRSRVEEVVEDVVESFSPGLSETSNDHLPYQFHELRDIADKLQILAEEVESISRNLRTESGTAQPQASRRLEDVLGQMREIRHAEQELHQQSRSR